MGSLHDLRFSDEQLAELSRLADGTLDPKRRAEVEALISTSPELRSTYERVRCIVELLHAVRAADRAPAHLRERLEAQRPTKPTRARHRAGYASVVGGALAAAAVALALVLPAGTPGSPSVSQAAALALRGASQPPPAADPNDPAAGLEQAVQGLRFPNWSALGWRAVGQRSDLLGGRAAATVYYGWQGRYVAYTIVARPALAEPAGPTTRLAGNSLRTLTMSGRMIVTWRRDRHTCVLSSIGLPVSELRALAVWNANGLRG